MARNVKLDQQDRAILRALQRDSTQPLETLGEQVGLSRNACWRRIRQMDDAGIIKKRVALLDSNALDLGLTVFIQVRAASHDAKWMSQFAAVTRAKPEITGVYRMSGDLDYLLRAVVPDMAGYDRLYQDLIRRIPMADVAASFVMEEIKHTTELPV